MVQIVRRRASNQEGRADFLFGNQFIQPARGKIGHCRAECRRSGTAWTSQPGPSRPGTCFRCYDCAQRSIDLTAAGAPKGYRRRWSTRPSGSAPSQPVRPSGGSVREWLDRRDSAMAVPTATNRASQPGRPNRGPSPCPPRPVRFVPRFVRPASSEKINRKPKVTNGNVIALEFISQMHLNVTSK